MDNGECQVDSHTLRVIDRLSKERGLTLAQKLSRLSELRRKSALNDQSFLIGKYRCLASGPRCDPQTKDRLNAVRVEEGPQNDDSESFTEAHIESQDAEVTYVAGPVGFGVCLLVDDNSLCVSVVDSKVLPDADYSGYPNGTRPFQAHALGLRVGDEILCVSGDSLHSKMLRGGEEIGPYFRRRVLTHKFSLSPLTITYRRYSSEKVIIMKIL